MRLSNPAPKRPVTSPYGPRRHPVTGQLGRMHTGVDFGGSFRVLVAGDGVVVHVAADWDSLSPLAKRRQSGGNVVVVEHGTNLFTAYFHGKDRSTLAVGQRVLAGDTVYTSGTTGVSTGNHLHFEVRRSRRGRQVDPMAFLSGNQPVNKKPVLKVDGRLGRNTWRAWQDVLKKDWGYVGRIDGRTGKLTWSAVQRSGVPFGYPANDIDGLFGPNTRRAVQRRLAKSKYYTGPIDGIWGRGTISAVQRALNEGKY